MSTIKSSICKRTRASSTVTANTEEPAEKSGQLGAAYRLAGLASALLLAGILIMLKDFSSSNRPHELKGAPLVALIMLANALVCFKLFRILGAMKTLSVGSYLLVFFALLASALTFLLLVGAASSVPAVLGW